MKEIRKLDAEGPQNGWTASCLPERLDRGRLKKVFSQLIFFTRGGHQEIVIGSLTFIIVTNSLIWWLREVLSCYHGFFADHLTITCRRLNREDIECTLQQGPSIVARVSHKSFKQLNV